MHTKKQHVTISGFGITDTTNITSKIKLDVIDGIEERLDVLGDFLIKKFNDLLEEREEYPRFYRDMAYFGLSDNEIKKAWVTRHAKYSTLGL